MRTVDMAATGRNIRRLREKKGFMAKDVAERIGTSPNSVYKWEHGYALPTIDNLVILADILDVTLDGVIITREV